MLAGGADELGRGFLAQTLQPRRRLGMVVPASWLQDRLVGELVEEVMLEPVLLRPGQHAGRLLDHQSFALKRKEVAAPAAGGEHGRVPEDVPDDSRALSRRAL